VKRFILFCTLVQSLWLTIKKKDWRIAPAEEWGENRHNPTKAAGKIPKHFVTIRYIEGHNCSHTEEMAGAEHSLTVRVDAVQKTKTGL
jgi:hypothetical protein